MNDIFSKYAVELLKLYEALRTKKIKNLLKIK